MRISDWSSDVCSSDLGGSTIISTVMQSIVNVVAFGMNMQQAVDAPRMHMQWLPDLIAVEPGLLTPDAQAKLEAMGHKIREMKSWGADEAILVDSDGALQSRTSVAEGKSGSVRVVLGGSRRFNKKKQYIQITQL